LNTKVLFAGFEECRPKREKPPLQIGEGIKFSGGSKSEQEAIKEVLLSVKQNIFEWTGQYGLLAGFPVSLPLKTGAEPVAHKQHRHKPELEVMKDAILTKWEEKGIIEDAKDSPWAANSFLVPKKFQPGETRPEKLWRLVEDYRDLNKCLEPMAYPMPSVEETLDTLSRNNEFYCTLDLNQGYHHLPLRLEDRKLTAFYGGTKHMQYKVLPFGIDRAAKTFQRVMATILRPHIGKRCLIYLDDIIVFGRTFQEMLDNLRLVLQALANAGAVLNLQKCNFLATKLEYLGHIIDQTGIHPNPKTTEAIRLFPRPESPKQAKRFLGLAGYLRKFSQKQAECEKVIRNSIHSEPMTAAKNGKKQGIREKLMWSQEAENAFLTIKDMLTDECRLARYNPDWPCEVHCDASATCLGSILAQRDEDGNAHILQYASRALSDAEQNYPNTDRELLAIRWAVTQKFRPYLESGKFAIFTDHQALLGELKLKKPSKRCLKFLMDLEEYQYELKYKPGHLLTGPDALSRMQQRQKAKSNIQPSACGAASNTDWSNPIDRKKLIADYHESFGHSCWKKTLAGIRQRFKWKGMRDDIWRFSRGCKQCFKFNSATQQIGTKLELHEVQRPKQRFGLDFYGPLPKTARGNRYALVGIDYMSKFMFVQPVPYANTATAIEFVEKVFHQYGQFEEIVTDRGSTFRITFQEYFRKQGVKVHVAQAGHFEGNGMAERSIKTLGEIQAKSNANSTNWDELITTSALKYNSTIHTAIGECPGDVFLGTEWICSADRCWKPPARTITPLPVVQERFGKYQQHLASRINRKRRNYFSPGDGVAIVKRLPNEQKHNADRRFRVRKQGPYTVISFHGHGQYIVTDGVTQICANGHEMIPWHQ
jgi:hypothetical protein